MQKKIARYALEYVDPNALSDMLTIMAGNVEDALIQAGVPETEYTAMKCFELAMPFALEVYRNRIEQVSFTLGWPDTGGD